MKRRIALVPTLVLCVIASELAAQAGNTGYNGSWRRDRPAQLGTVSPDAWIRMDTVSNWVLVPGTPQDVYRKVQYIYGSLKIKLTHSDSVSGIIGNTGFHNTGAYAGQRMSYWLGCGQGMTGPNADRWRVTMAILSSVEPASKDTTRLRTVIIATAKNVAEGSAVPSNCNSTGKLEEEIHKKVQAMPAVSSGSE